MTARELPEVEPLEPENRESRIVRRSMLQLGWMAAASIFFLQPIIALVRLSLSNDDASHLVLIPFLAAGLLVVERRSVFRNVSYGVRPGALVLLLAVGLLAALSLAGRAWTPDLVLAGRIVALLLVWIAGFLFFFGSAALRAGHFAFLFLFLMVPPPDFLLQRVIYLLQAGSADITGALFDLVGVPALREGFVFRLPRLTIEVAAECSGIRSSMALLILALPLVHFGLRPRWKKLVFLACALLVMVLKNGIRIVTLTLLGIYVDPGFLYGRLHNEGGVVFFLLGLLLLLPVYLLLRAGDRRAAAGGTPARAQ